MKITLKSLEDVLKNGTGNLEQDDFLCYIPEDMFGTTVDARVYKTHSYDIVTYMTDNSYIVPSDFVEEVIDD